MIIHSSDSDPLIGKSTSQIPVPSLQHPIFSFPDQTIVTNLNLRLADPFVASLSDGSFILLATEPRMESVQLRMAKNILDLGQVTEIEIYNGGPSSEVWAPELHFLSSEGKLSTVVIFTEGKGAEHRMRVLECAPENILDPLAWIDRGIISFSQPEDNRWAIDGTYFEHNAKLYLIWSGWAGTKDQEAQNIYICEMSSPCTPVVGSRPVMISTPSYAWESWINEGPQIVKNGDTISLLFSCHHSWENDYKMGVIHNRGGNLLNPEDWEKSPKPFVGTLEDQSGIHYALGHGMVAQIEDKQFLVCHKARFDRSGWERELVILKIANDDDYSNFKIE